MMFEELPDLHIDRELIAARCVHLYTEDPAGTPFGKVIMKHLDLAVVLRSPLTSRFSLRDGFDWNNVLRYV